MNQSHGICALSVINVYQEPSETSVIVNQLLYGDHFEIVQAQKFWSAIRLDYDQTEGYVLNSLFTTITPEQADLLSDYSKAIYNQNLTHYAIVDTHGTLPLLIGSRLDPMPMMGHHLEQAMSDFKSKGENSSEQLVNTALKYMYAPYMLGGRSPFGIDASGFTQMVYKSCHIFLPRDIESQSKQGQTLSFIEESQPGDLVFFDNEAGELIHVGMLLPNNYILHAHGCVRIDRLDHTGIFNPDLNQYTHSLRVIKTLQ
ncbi:MAG: hypothetical protein RLZZ242_697 [Bacteroidota bacterium]